MYSKIILLLTLAMLTFTNCDKNKDYDAIDKELIEKYLVDNNLTAEEHDSGLFYTITATGDGTHPSSAAVVKVKYLGKLLNGSVFDRTPAGDVSGPWPLSGLIEGWRIGIPLIEKGGKATLYIPSTLGYGAQATGSIPANSVLIFDIELVDF